MDDFDLDQPTSAGELEGEPARLRKRAKGAHRREGAAHVFNNWRQEIDDPYEVPDVKVNDKIRVATGKVVQDNTMTSEKAAEVLQHLDGEYLAKVKFVREQAPDVWVIDDGFVPLKEGRTRGGAVLEISSRTMPGSLERIDRLFQNTYPVAEVVYGLYPIREPDLANLLPMLDGDFNCVERFECASRGQGLTPVRRQKIGEWEERVHDTGATVGDVAELEKILKRGVTIRDIVGEDIMPQRARTSLSPAKFISTRAMYGRRSKMPLRTKPRQSGFSEVEIKSLPSTSSFSTTAGPIARRKSRAT